MSAANRLAMAILLLLLSARAAVAGPTYDIFIIGDRSHPRTRPIMQSLRAMFSEARSRSGKTVQDVPIDEYDSTAPEHRVAIRRLGLERTTLPLVGVAALDARGVPDHVVAVVSPAVDEDAVYGLLVIAGAKIGVSPRIAVMAAPPSAPTASGVEAAWVGTWKTSFADINGQVTSLVCVNGPNATFTHFTIMGGARVPFQTGQCTGMGSGVFTVVYTSGPMSGMTDNCLYRLSGSDVIITYSSLYRNILTWHRIAD